MTDGKTLLAHLAPKLDDHTENIAVEALGYILNSSVPAVRAIEDALRTGGAEVGSLSDTRTQDSDEKGRPDLSCFDEYGVERVLIEAKFWAGLTDNQPIAYLERLPSDKSSALLFVAPTARFEPLWAELTRRVAESGEFELGASSERENLRSVVVGGERRLMLTSWKALLGRMASQASAAGDSRVETDIRQLLGLTQRMDEDAFLPIQSEELGPGFPRRMLGLPRIIEGATERGRVAGWIDTEGLSTSARSTGWGRYMRLGRVDRAGVLFGYSFEFWAKHRDAPLRLRFEEWDDTMRVDEVQRRLEPLRHEVPPGAIYEKYYTLIPIYLPIGVEYTAVVDAVVARLESVARMIDPHM